MALLLLLPISSGRSLERVSAQAANWSGWGGAGRVGGQAHWSRGSGELCLVARGGGAGLSPPGVVRS